MGIQFSSHSPLIALPASTRFAVGRVQRGFGVLGGGPPPPPSDPHFASVVLLAVNDNQPNGTTVFVDQSPLAHLMFRGGSAVYDSAQAPPGMTSSVFTDGMIGHIRAEAASGVSWNFDTGDFTIEGMVRFRTLKPGGLWLRDSNVAYCGLIQSSDQLSVGLGSAFTTNIPWTHVANVWYHYAYTRSSSSIRVFIDGVQLGPVITNNFNFSALNTAVYMNHINSDSSVFQCLDGWQSNIRITKGVARYTANFVPPTIPFPTS